MQNVHMRLDGDKLLIEIDLTKTLYQTPKADIVATMQGWFPLHEFGHGNVAVSMDVIRKKNGVYHVKHEVV